MSDALHDIKFRAPYLIADDTIDGGAVTTASITGHADPLEHDGQIIVSAEESLRKKFDAVVKMLDWEVDDAEAEVLRSEAIRSWMLPSCTNGCRDCGWCECGGYFTERGECDGCGCGPESYGPCAMDFWRDVTEGTISEHATGIVIAAMPYTTFSLAVLQTSRGSTCRR